MSSGRLGVVAVVVCVAIFLSLGCGDDPAPVDPVCGDGVVDDGEGCDDGNTVNGDGCDAQCQVEVDPPPVCGDGVVEGDEACDDGNLVAADGCSPTCERYPDQAVFDGLVEDLQAECQGEGVPGAALAVVVEGELRFVAGVGERRVEQGDPVDGDTLFALASVTKTFTAAGALALADEGTVSLSEPITTYLPQFGVAPPHDPTAVTLHGLLSHTAGYPNVLVFDPGDGIDYNQPSCLVDLFAYYNDEPLWFTPGVLWNYSNNGYMLAGAVLQAAAGEPFGDVVTSRVLRPGGMETATFSDVATWDSTNHAWGHDLGAGSTPVVWQPVGERYSYEPMGGLYSSARDLGRFLVAVLADDGRFLSSASLAAWTAGQTPTNIGAGLYGYGVEREERAGGAVLLGHGGAQAGFRAQIHWAPDTGFGVAAVQNASFGWCYWTAADAAVEAFSGLPPRDPPTYTGPTEWVAYEGTYTDPHFWGAITFSVQGNTLQAQWIDVGTTTDCMQFDGHYWGCSAPASSLHGEPLGSMIYGSFWLDPPSPVAHWSTRYGVATRP